jgi:hypothetical protein
MATGFSLLLPMSFEEAQRRRFDDDRKGSQDETAKIPSGLGRGARA